MKDLNSKVGGFMGFGKTWSNSRVTLDRDIYTVGDTIRVTIDCDNSECKKAIDAFKIKLLRNIQATSLLGTGGDGTRNANHQKYISIYKESEGAAAH